MEEAKKAGSRIHYLGHEFDHRTWNRLFHENRYTLWRSFKNAFNLNHLYLYELVDFKSQLHKYGAKKFVESSCDQYTLNWMVQLTNIIFPDVKRVIVDKKDDDLFKEIIENKGKVSTLFKINREW